METVHAKRADDRRLDEELDRKHPPTWRPESTGDTIRGEFVRLDYADKFECAVAVINTTDGERALFLFHTVLKNKLARIAPKPGERLAIRYDGQVASADGKRRYHDYSVAVARESQQSRLSWSDIADDSETSAPDVDVPIDMSSFETSSATPRPGEDDDVPF